MILKSQKEQGYFIAEDECVWCGCCQKIAPELFSNHPEINVTKVSRQPKNQSDLKKVFRAQRVCMVDCIYYEGPDKLLKEYSTKIATCYENRGGNVCSEDHCPCFEEYIAAKAAIKAT